MDMARVMASDLVFPKGESEIEAEFNNPDAQADLKRLDCRPCLYHGWRRIARQEIQIMVVSLRDEETLNLMSARGSS